MIEFNGLLTGEAAKRYYKKNRMLEQQLMIVAMVVVLPLFFLIFSNVASIKILLPAGGILCVYLLCVPVIPKGKKEKLAITPRRIVLNDDQLICTAERFVEYKFIDDVKVVYDAGAYYEIVFPFGKISNKFICQKDLLTKGSLHEFESYFKGKIVRTQDRGRFA